MSKQYFKKRQHLHVYIDLHEEYKSERGVVALEKDDLHTIDASGQPCAKFGLHPKLPKLQSLYQDKDATFFANIGVLNKVRKHVDITVSATFQSSDFHLFYL